MNKPFYLYIFEDGTVKKQMSSPTDEDCINVQDGILTVIEVIGAKALILNNNYFEPSDQAWLELENE